MSSEVEESRPVDENRTCEDVKDVKQPTEPTENVNFTKPAVRTPGKFNLPKHKKLKIKRKLVRQNSKKRHETTFKKKIDHFKLKKKRLRHNKFFSSTYKRRTKERAIIIPPTKFLLGGNICDPLNLNSLQDEETNRVMNAATPKSSPLPTPRRRGEVEVIIPRNLKDPLNLISCADDNEYEKDLKSLAKRSRKHRHRKRKRGSSGSGSGKDESNELILPSIKVEEPSAVPVEKVEEKETSVNKEVEKVPEAPEEERSTNITEKIPEEPVKNKRESLSLTIKENPRHSNYRTRKMDDKDKIVSPVIPQPGAWKKPRLSLLPQNRKRKDEKMPQFKDKNSKYQYGNYDRYYGYRNPHHEIDLRLRCLMDHKELFFDKDILDIGCNVGHITLSVARDFGARSAVGLDIDKKLINIARKNVKHYVNCVPTPAYSGGGFSIRNPPPFESPMYYDSKKNHYVFQDSPSMNSRATPLYSYPESPVNRNPHQYCMESPSYAPSGKNTPYYSMESPSYHPSIAESPSYRRNYALDSPSYIQQSPSYHSGRNTPFYNLESPSYQSHCSLEQKRSPQDIGGGADGADKKNCDKFFPISMPILYGPVDPPGISTQEDSNFPKTFPHNVTFVQGNYVLESDILLATDTPQFDIILALSITKWIHLNWGDVGLKQAFKRMYTQLRPGGKLILEAQGWASYKKKKNLTETIYNNYRSIEFMPDQFTQYLLSPEIGFSKVEILGTPHHTSKGFQRAIQLFIKSGTTPSRSTTPASRSTPSNVRFTPYYQRICVRRPVYTSLTVPLDEEGSSSPKQNFLNDFSVDTQGGQNMRVKFSPSDVGPCGTRLDVSEDILKGSELTLPVSDVDQTEKVLDKKMLEEAETETEEMEVIEENESERIVRNSQSVVNTESSNSEKLVCPV